MKAIFCWSGGKDSSFALYKILQQDQYEVVCLLTTINEENHRVSMHGIREELIDEQARQIGIPLEKVMIPNDSSMLEYEKRMEYVLLKYKALGVEYMIFGDIFLEDLKEYREKNLSKIGMSAVFPLWKLNTRQLIDEFCDAGFSTIICCTDNEFFDDSIVGKVIDKSLVDSFENNVDPCGENGEFHSFAFKGPIFKNEVNFKIGEKVLKTYNSKYHKDDKEVIMQKGFWFIDLLKE